MTARLHCLHLNAYKTTAVEAVLVGSCWRDVMKPPAVPCQMGFVECPVTLPVPRLEAPMPRRPVRWVQRSRTTDTLELTFEVNWATAAICSRHPPRSMLGWSMHGKIVMQRKWPVRPPL